MAERKFGLMGLSENVVKVMQEGIMNWSYRGLPTWKCPFDLELPGCDLGDKAAHHRQVRLQ
jgi:hypothetical protein